MKAELAQKQAEYQAADKALNEAQSTLSQGKQAVAVGDKSLALGEKSVALGVDAPGAGEKTVWHWGTAAWLTGITACPSAVKVRNVF
ncbi:adhesin [Proteus mirabilis]|uniref:Adhesin n=1 Tax=Proteus mirabilis TaxID=584 RepID=A0A2X2C649_PROMI|nr:adhesin [Proteus mirabilis]